MTKITIPDTADLLARIAELEAALSVVDTQLQQQHRARKVWAKRAIRAEAALTEIIMEATSRNHAIDIARRARHGSGE